MGRLCDAQTYSGIRAGGKALEQYPIEWNDARLGLPALNPQGALSGRAEEEQKKEKEWMIAHILSNARRLTRRWVVLSSLVGLVALAAVAVMGPAASHAGSETASSQLAFPISRLTIETAAGRFDIIVEVADTWERRMWGLQHRRTLAADAGMLFDYKESRPVAMWMKNTYVPLDMLFIGATGRVARVVGHTQPLSLTPIPSGEPVRAVLELNAGTAERLGVRPGDSIHHPIFDSPAN